MTARYCVVGGGISGLAAAYRLRTALGADADITLYDPADRLGGILRTETVAGHPMDLGAEAYVARRPEVPALLAELGLTDRVRLPTGARPLIRSGGELHPLPAGTVNGVPSASAPLAGLVDAATLARIDAEEHRRLPWTPGADPALGELVAERFGEQVVTRSVDPLVGGVYSGSAATVGLRSATPALAAALDAGATSLTAAVRRALPPTGSAPVFAALAGGYTVLVRELAARAGLSWIRQAVTGIAADGAGWALTAGDGSTRHADAVVLAAGAPVLAGLLDGVAPRAAAAAARIDCASAVVVALALPAGVGLPDNSGVLMAGGEPLHTKAITLSSRKWGTGDGMQLVRLSYGRFGAPVHAGDSELLDWAAADLAAVFGVAADPVDTRVRRWERSMPQYLPGHAGLVAELRAGLPPTLAVAGNFLDGIGVPACLAAADRAVADLLAVAAAG